MAWLLREESLGLRRIDGDWVLRTTCGSERCVNPRHMEPVNKPHRDLDDTSCARGHEMTEENGYRAPERWAWSRLAGELGLDRLRLYGCLRRECAREGCLRPEHQTTRQPMPPARQRRFTALLANLPQVVIPGSRSEAFSESAAAEEEEQSEAALRALRYRTDPDFRAQVRAELRAQARARTEHSRISQKRRARAGRTRTTSKETIDG